MCLNELNFAHDFGLNVKTLPIIFLHCFVFFCCCCLQEITHSKMQVFLDKPWQQMRTSLIILFAKTKALFGKDAAGKNALLLLLFFVYSMLYNVM